MRYDSGIGGAAMPIFMDRHDVWETTAADVAATRGMGAADTRTGM